MGKYLMLAILIVFQLPAQAMTQAADRVNVLSFRIHDEGTEEPEQINVKSWAQLKLSEATRKKISAYNTQLDQSSGGIEKYRLAWIRMFNDDIQGYLFQGNRSSVWLIEPPNSYNGHKSKFFSLSLEGNSGIFCVHV